MSIGSTPSSSARTVVGVMKLKRKSVKAGYAKVRLVEAEDSIQVICRHQTAQGLKAVWKSLLWRIQPQHGTPTELTPQICQEKVLKALKSYEGYLDNINWSARANGIDFRINYDAKKRPKVPSDDQWRISKEQVASGYGVENMFDYIFENDENRLFLLVESCGMLRVKFLDAESAPAGEAEEETSNSRSSRSGRRRRRPRRSSSDW